MNIGNGMAMLLRVFFLFKMTRTMITQPVLPPHFQLHKSVT